MRTASDPRRAQRLIAEALPPAVASVLAPEELETMRQRLQKLPEPPTQPRLSKDDCKGVLGVFLLVFLSTFPVAIPFLFMQNAVPALRVAKGIAMALLVLSGFAFGRMTGRHSWLIGLSMVLLGSVLVAITMPSAAEADGPGPDAPALDGGVRPGDSAIRTAASC